VLIPTPTSGTLKYKVKPKVRMIYALLWEDIFPATFANPICNDETVTILKDLAFKIEETR